VEQSLADSLFEQRKGFLMYTVFDKQIAQQFATFNDSVEWLVLANSDPHSDKAAFLHRESQQIFWRLDLFSGANQQSFGLYGRVISMGDRFDVPGGTLRLHIDPIAGFVHLPTGKEGWGYSSDWAPSTVAVGLRTTFQLGGIFPIPAILEGKAALVFGTYGSTNGFVHAKKLTATSPEAFHLDWTERSVLVTLDAGKSYPLLLETEASISQEPSGLDKTEIQPHRQQQVLEFIPGREMNE
jgi:hypothetical protein